MIHAPSTNRELSVAELTGVYTLQAIRTHRYAVRKANQRWRPIGANNDNDQIALGWGDFL